MKTLNLEEYKRWVDNAVKERSGCICDEREVETIRRVQAAHRAGLMEAVWKLEENDFFKIQC